MAVSFKGAHFPKEVILMGVRWYVAYPLSTRHVEELMEERGVDVDHATKVFHMCWTSQMARPNSYRFMKSPITRSCICSALEKHSVRRTHRLMRVRRLMCLLSIFWVFAFPT